MAKQGVSRRTYAAGRHCSQTVEDGVHVSAACAGGSDGDGGGARDDAAAATTVEAAEEEGRQRWLTAQSAAVDRTAAWR